MQNQSRTLRTVLSLALAVCTLLPGGLLAAGRVACRDLQPDACCSGYGQPSCGASGASATLTSADCVCDAGTPPTPPARGAATSQLELLLLGLTAHAATVGAPSSGAWSAPPAPRDDPPQAGARELRERHCIFRI